MTNTYSYFRFNSCLRLLFLASNILTQSQGYSVPSPSPLSSSSPSNNVIDRRSALLSTTAASILLLTASTNSSPASALSTSNYYNKNPTLKLKSPNQNVKIPKIGYSFYKTESSQVEQGLNLALHAGVRHFDVGSLYNTNSIVGQVLYDYCTYGLQPIDEKGFIIPHDGQQDSRNKRVSSSAFLKRRKDLFITHKIKNEEQDTEIQNVKQTVQKEITDNSKTSYLDMLMIHSPLTDQQRRLTTYKAMIELKQEGTVKAIGVCNFGVKLLDEIIQAGLPAPDVIQLQLSPFNQHKDIVAWSNKHNSILSCSAWSKLSGVDGPQDGWQILANIAQKKNMTKAQVLIAWAFQKNYLCVPRSGVKSKLERKAIFENSYAGVIDKDDYHLTDDEMNLLNGLDESLKPGRLGVLDGWNVDDILGKDWDPTDISS